MTPQEGAPWWKLHLHMVTRPCLVYTSERLLLAYFASDVLLTREQEAGKLIYHELCSCLNAAVKSAHPKRGFGHPRCASRNPL
jgi:hypothetical protein